MTGYTRIAHSDDEATWLAERARRVTATDIPRIIAGSPTAWASVKADKVSPPAFRGNRYTRWGHEREPVIAEFLSTLHGLRPNRWLLAREDHPSHAATPDAISEQGTLLGEIKTTVKDWETPDDIPASYRWQMQWQMYVTGARRTMFAFELHEDFVPVWPEPRVFVVERDDAAIAQAVEQAVLWEAFEPGDTPPPPPGLSELLGTHQALKDAVDAANARLTALEGEMRALLVEHDWAGEYEDAGVKLAYSGVPRSSQRFDSAAFKRADPARYAEFVKATTEAQPRLSITTPRS